MLVAGSRTIHRGTEKATKALKKKASTFQVIHCSTPHPRSLLVLIFLACYLTNVICYPFNSK